MALDLKLHTVSHENAVTSGIENSSMHGQLALLSILTLSQTVSILPQKQAKQPFHVIISVSI